MRTHGTLTKWNDERGFGFVALPERGEEVFVHISAFPPGDRPRVGDMISFEITQGADGRKRAANVTRPGAIRDTASAARRSDRARDGVAPAVAAFAMIVGLGIFGWRAYSSRVAAIEANAGPTPLATPLPRTTPHVATSFHCDGRTLCSQMHSCAEATYFLQNCPNTQMDGNHDGEPCEQQWCN